MKQLKRYVAFNPSSSDKEELKRLRN